MENTKVNFTINNSIELNDKLEEKGKGHYFKSRFIEPGLATYQELGTVLITKETLNKFINTIVGCPVIILHKDINDKNADKERVGVVSDVWYDDNDGWFYCSGVIWNTQAIDLVKNQGWNVSCSYSFESDNTKGIHNGTEYSMQFVNGEFLHLAIVSTPRYNLANIVVNSKDLEVVENEDKWITIHPNGEDEKGRHLLLKDGETPKEAIERVYKKKDHKETPKKDEEKDVRDKLYDLQQIPKEKLEQKHIDEMENLKKSMIDSANKKLEANKENKNLPKLTITKKSEYQQLYTDDNYISDGNFAMKTDAIRVDDKQQKEKQFAHITKLIPDEKEYKNEAATDLSHYEQINPYSDKKVRDVVKIKQGNQTRYIDKKYFDLTKGATLHIRKDNDPKTPIMVKKDNKPIGLIMPILMGNSEKELKKKVANNDIDTIKRKDNIIMEILNDFKALVEGIVNNALNKEKEVENEEKEEIKEEIKEEKAENKCKAKNEADEKEEKETVETEKEEVKDCKNEADKEEKEEKFEEQKEIAENEEKEEKEVKNSMDSVKDAIMGGNSEIKNVGLYTSQAERLELGNKY